VSRNKGTGNAPHHDKSARGRFCRTDRRDAHLARRASVRALQVNYSEDGNDVLIDLSFKIPVEAAAFSARFNDAGADATSTSPTPTVERDIPIGQAGDVSIGDSGAAGQFARVAAAPGVNS
jgi:hypothetical protein